MASLPTWGDLCDLYCADRTSPDSVTRSLLSRNPFYEPLAARRYNYSPSLDTDAVRLVFLGPVGEQKGNQTLLRKGRFIWCKDLKYEGRNEDGHRRVSFTVDKGKKRFMISENNILCIPAKSFINNNRYFRTKDKTFLPFSTVFSYKNALRIMHRRTTLTMSDFVTMINDDSPYVPGTLVSPRLGYFYPRLTSDSDGISPRTTHPCGIILGRALDSSGDLGREFYRVRFGDTTYERVHPIQLEILNEV